MIRADSPMYLSTMAEATTLRNVALMLEARARARRVLPAKVESSEAMMDADQRLNSHTNKPLPVARINSAIIRNDGERRQFVNMF